MIHHHHWREQHVNSHKMANDFAGYVYSVAFGIAGRGWGERAACGPGTAGAGLTSGADLSMLPVASKPAASASCPALQHQSHQRRTLPSANPSISVSPSSQPSTSPTGHVFFSPTFQRRNNNHVLIHSLRIQGGLQIHNNQNKLP